ncbi:MAG: hypothetical protein HC790_04780 [Acaryochloridaceae cyanobacterium CSU_3_4]|nr:hypothetical protein [Acaryochloridaceae cyanobacterium CSU_3_4]
MSDSNNSPFNQQLAKWWGMVSKKETWDSFKQFFILVWQIFKETGLLIYLFILGGLVSIGWVVDRSTELTESVKSLQNQANQAEEGNLLSEAGKSLWVATKKGAESALETARTTLNIEAPPKKEAKDPPGTSGTNTGTGTSQSNTGDASSNKETSSSTDPSDKAGDTSSGSSANNVGQETEYVDDPQEP